jgi:hypothetical protein
MPANHKVSVAWQIVFTILPFIDLWAFYRIRRLRKYLLYTYLPEVAIVIAYVWYFEPTEENQTNPTLKLISWLLLAFDFSYPEIINTLIALCFLGLAIYLVIIWSRQHNRKYSAPTPSA